MRRILRRSLQAGGAGSFLAGYIGCPLLIGLVDAIFTGLEKHSLMSVLGAPLECLLVCLLACFLAPVGLIVGMTIGIDPKFPGWPGWLRWLGWGPWDGRFLFMGLMAGLVVLVAVGRRLEQRYTVPDDGDDTSRVPTARVVTAHLFPTVAWKPLIGPIGPILLVIAGAAFAGLACVGLAVLAMLDR